MKRAIDIIKRTCLIIIAGLIASACSRAAAPTVSTKAYQSATLGISLSYPTGWQISDKGHVLTSGVIDIASEANLDISKAEQWQGGQGWISVGAAVLPANASSQAPAFTSTWLVQTIAAEVGNGGVNIDEAEKVHLETLNGKEYAIASYHVTRKGRIYTTFIAADVQPTQYVFLYAITTLDHEQAFRKVLVAVISSIDFKPTAAMLATAGAAATP